LSPVDELWHELVLSGVGGRTVAEAKERVQYAEFMDWVISRRMRGSFHVGTRLESGVALLASLISRACGGNASQLDFMPHAEPASTADATLSDVVAILSGGQR
jgi:hypothetical protein